MTGTHRRPATLVTGHRGARGIWPENSLTGFSRVSALGVDAIEFDVHRTGSAELLVVHDAWLERTTDGVGPVRDLSPRGRRQIRLQDTDEMVPTLGEVLDVLARTTREELHIELKNDEAGRPYEGLIESVLTDVDHRALRHRCHLASFDVAVLESCRRVAPDVPRLISVDAAWADRLGGLDRFSTASTTWWMSSLSTSPCWVGGGTPSPAGSRRRGSASGRSTTRTGCVRGSTAGSATSPPIVPTSPSGSGTVPRRRDSRRVLQ
jgi:glycerophosphoryl diester phosphodiesterase